MQVHITIHKATDGGTQSFNWREVCRKGAGEVETEGLGCPMAREGGVVGDAEVVISRQRRLCTVDYTQ